MKEPRTFDGISYGPAWDIVPAGISLAAIEAAHRRRYVVKRGPHHLVRKPGHVACYDCVRVWYAGINR